MLLLILSIAVLAAGPLLHLGAKRVATLAALDGFVMMAIVGLVVVHIVPHATVNAGFLAILVTIIGMLGPSLMEKTLHKAAAKVHGITFWLAVLGLIIHGFFDGVGLATPSALHVHEASMLPVAVLLHRLPVSVTLWWLLQPKLGTLKTLLVLVGVAITTLIGYQTEAFASSLNGTWLSLIQAFIAGSVLHVVLHQPVAMHDTDRTRFHSGLGAIAGIALVIIMLATSTTEHIDNETSHISSTFLDLCLESAPALLFAFVISGFVYMLLPTLPKRWMQSKSPSREALRGVAFGLPLPICSCGVVPLYQTLVQQSVPATAAMAFLVATPELGVDAIILSLPLLGPEMTVIRVAAAVILALIIGVYVGRMAKATQPSPSLEATHSHDSNQHLSWPEKISKALSFGFGEIVDHTGPWLVLGIAIAAMVAPIFQGSWISSLPWGVDVLFFTLLGLPAYVCASGATPLVAVLLAQGISPGAGLAFLLAGPATNVTTFGILTSLHTKRIATIFAVSMGSMALVMGLLVNVIADRFITIEAPMLHSHGHGYFSIVCLTILGIAFAGSLLRQGPRGFIGQIMSPFAGPEDEHDHCCDH